MTESTNSPTHSLARDAVRRKPSQGRSLASYERMLATTKALLLERGSDDFTLQDVSERGGVSIGSIYLRFESKDKLLHAVIAEELQSVAEGERELLKRLLRKKSDLEGFLIAFIKEYSAFLAEHAVLLSLIMQRAANDGAVSGPGRETAKRSEDMTVDAILTFSDEIKSEDKEHKVRVVYQTVFATIARQYGLGSTAESADPKVWEMAKDELAKMMLAYLRYSD